MSREQTLLAFIIGALLIASLAVVIVRAADDGDEVLLPSPTATEPTFSPTAEPTFSPTEEPTVEPTDTASPQATDTPTGGPTETPEPTESPEPIDGEPDGMDREEVPDTGVGSQPLLGAGLLAGAAGLALGARRRRPS